jgi:hypothetical protein
MRTASNYPTRIVAGTACLLACTFVQAATEDIEYVAEHLSEAAMNFRVATLPLWGSASTDWTLTAQGAWGAVRSGTLDVSGPLTSLGAQRRLSDRWTVTGFGFYDRLRFSGGGGTQSLVVRFAGPVPLDLPADAELGRAGGSVTDVGAGVAFGYEIASGFARDWRMTFGAQAQRLRLSSYSVPYRLSSGASAGATGEIDYSGNYNFMTLLLGASRRFERNDWALTPHLLFAQPLPRRGVQGRIVGQNFEIAGNTADAGQGKHYGDPALTFGLEVEYRPWRVSLDLGALVTQPFMEPYMHNGLDRSLLLSLSFRL